MRTKEEAIKHIDSLVDSYHGGGHSLPDLLLLRKDLAVWSYYLAGFVRETHGKSALSYAKRKHAVAEHIVNARSLDAKTPISFLETSAMKLPTVMEAIKAEAWAEAEKDELQARLKAINNVLSAMQQELADMRAEKGSPHHQSEGA